MLDDVDLRERVDHQLLHRLIAADAGATTAHIQSLYEAVAPLVYHGTTSEPLHHRRPRRNVLNDLVDEKRVAVHETPRGRVWVPLTLPAGMDVKHSARAARGDRESEQGDGGTA